MMRVCSGVAKQMARGGQTALLRESESSRCVMCVRRDRVRAIV